MMKSIGRTLAHIDVAANTSVRIHEDFFNISNEVGRVKRDLIFVSKLDRSVPFLRSGLPFFFLSFLVSDPRFRRKISR